MGRGDTEPKWSHCFSLGPYDNFECCNSSYEDNGAKCKDKERGGTNHHKNQSKNKCYVQCCFNSQYVNNLKGNHCLQVDLCEYLKIFNKCGKSYDGYKFVNNKSKCVKRGRCKRNPCLRCHSNTPGNKKECHDSHENPVDSDSKKIQICLNDTSRKESPGINKETLIATLTTLLVLAIIFILLIILWISLRRKRNSTPDDTLTTSNTQNVNENNHPYEEINETAISSFCNSTIVDKNSTTTSTGNTGEETYEVLEEKSSPGYDKLVFNDLCQVNNENGNNLYHLVEK